ncbi:MAG: HU family DNA-binding protein [Phocaeicola sp.]
MNQKVTISELSEVIAEKHGMDKKEAELFVKGIFELIEEALTTEKYVKVKGFGTFKLIEVDNRESINVNTGERFEIQGHTKISFSPDAGLKEFINKPFSHFETVLLNEKTELPNDESVEKPNSEEEEYAECLTISEESSGANLLLDKPDLKGLEEVADATCLADVAVKSEQKEEVIKEVIANQTNQTADILTDSSILQEKNQVDPQVDSQANPQVDLQVDPQVDSQEKIEEALQENPCERIDLPLSSVQVEKKSRRWSLYVVLLLFALLLLGYGVYYFVLKETPSSQKMDPIVTLSEVEDAMDEDSLKVYAASDTTICKVPMEDAISAEEVIVDKKQYSKDLKYEIVGTQTTHILKAGESLSLLAIHYYGVNEFWTYIVRHNRDIINNVDNVPLGIALKIPELRKKE